MKALHLLLLAVAGFGGLARSASMQDCAMSTLWNTCTTQYMTSNGQCPDSCKQAVSQEADCISIIRSQVTGTTLQAL